MRSWQVPAAPRLFENRLCFRLIGLDWTRTITWMSFDQTSFFDATDTNEALAHEFAAHHLTENDDALI
jgi:hypothetical protein